jgi:glycosyltransferase involved in cell wall biosynthesis
MNWVHRKTQTGLKHFLRSEFYNYLLSMTRRRLADRIVYQSQFSQEWWNRVYGLVDAQTTCVYNAVDLNTFSPEGAHERPQGYIRVLLVEGRLGGGYEQGLENAIRLCELLDQHVTPQVELMVVGKVPSALRDEWNAKTSLRINWAGVVSRDQIPEIDRSAHVFFSADLNAACPNSVIEALACGCPVIGYRTGALAELVANGAGELVDWGSDYWNLENPVPEPLVAAAVKVIEQQDQYRKNARVQAERFFGLDQMIEGYLKALLG